MKEIQTFPFALQSLLQIKGSIAPIGLEDNMRLTIDSLTLLLIQRQEQVIFANVSTVATGANTFPDSVVPVGETWYVWHFNIAATLAVGNTVKICPSVILANSNIPVAISQSYVASERLKLAALGPLLLSGGNSLGFDVGIITGAAFNVNGQAIISRLKA